MQAQYLRMVYKLVQISNIMKYTDIIVSGQKGHVVIIVNMTYSNAVTQWSFTIFPGSTNYKIPY